MSFPQAPICESSTASDHEATFTVYHGVVVPARGGMTEDIRKSLAGYGLNFGLKVIVARCPAFAVSNFWGPRGTLICLDEPDREMQTTKITYITRYKFKYTHSEQGILEVVFADEKTESPHNLQEEVTFGQALKDLYGFPQASLEPRSVSDVRSSLAP
jgi:hypothetical protein